MGKDLRSENCSSNSVTATLTLFLVNEKNLPLDTPHAYPGFKEENYEPIKEHVYTLVNTSEEVTLAVLRLGLTTEKGVKLHQHIFYNFPKEQFDTLINFIETNFPCQEP